MKKCLQEGNFLYMLWQIIDALPADMPLMDAMRTAVSAYAHTHFKDETIEDQAIILTAALPVIIARHYRNQQWTINSLKPNPDFIAHSKLFVDANRRYSK